MAINQRFLQCMHHCGLDQLVDFPTRQEATLDLFLANRPSLVDKCTAAPGVADHDMVHVTTTATNLSYRKAKKTGKIKDKARYQRLKRDLPESLR